MKISSLFFNFIISHPLVTLRFIRQSSEYDLENSQIKTLTYILQKLICELSLTHHHHYYQDQQILQIIIKMFYIKSKQLVAVSIKSIDVIGSLAIV